jgi:flagellar biosynthesis/type III secretory pathway protein FliH
MQEGREAGRQGGRQGGRQEGREAGREAGRKAGRQAGRLDAVIIFHPICISVGLHINKYCTYVFVILTTVTRMSTGLMG